MNRVCELLIRGLARFVQPESKDAAIGDIAELNLGPPATIYELCGLIARQQAAFWKCWRPWVVVFGILGVVGIPLFVLAGTLAGTVTRYLATYLRYGVMYQSGLSLPEEFALWLSLAAAVILWSWIAGFVFTSMARKAMVAAGALLCFLWLGWVSEMLIRALMLQRFPSVFPWCLNFILIPAFFLLPAVWGARRALTGHYVSSRQALVLFLLTIASIALLTWMSGWPETAVARWSEGAIPGPAPWYERRILYMLLLMSWPAGWIFATRSRTHREIRGD